MNLNTILIKEVLPFIHKKLGIHDDPDNPIRYCGESFNEILLNYQHDGFLIVYPCLFVDTKCRTNITFKEKLEWQAVFYFNRGVWHRRRNGCRCNCFPEPTSIPDDWKEILHIGFPSKTLQNT